MKRLEVSGVNPHYVVKEDGIVYRDGKPFAYFSYYDASKQKMKGYKTKIDIFETGIRITSESEVHGKSINFYSNAGVHVATLSTKDPEEMDKIAIDPLDEGVIVRRPENWACASVEFKDYNGQNQNFDASNMSISELLNSDEEITR